jgi:hypothetical protein
LNVVDGPGVRIWAYLSDYMRGSGQPGWRLPVPYWLAIMMVRLAFSTVFRTASKVPSILIPRRFESRLKPLRFSNRNLRETLEWVPPLDHKQCLARTYGQRFQPQSSVGTVSRGSDSIGAAAPAEGHTGADAPDPFIPGNVPAMAARSIGP